MSTPAGAPAPSRRKFVVTVAQNSPAQRRAGDPEIRVLGKKAGAVPVPTPVTDSSSTNPGPAREGQAAPTFSLPSQTGEQVALADLRGQWVVLYFYPADDTPGCTAEACSFRDSFEDFVEAGAAVVGVSSDSVNSHTKFAEKHNLPFTLLSDSDKELAKTYGVKKSMGLFPGRVTYVIDPDGIVRKIFSSQLGAKKHHTEALAAIRAGAKT